MKYLVEAGVLGVRRVRREDITNLAAATGGTVLPNLADLEGGESVEPSMLGSADEVAEERVGDGELVFIRGTRTSRSVSLVLRGANEFLLDEVDRSLHDTLCVVQKVLESRSLVAGGGAVEAALSVYLDGFATTLGSKEQLAIKVRARADGRVLCGQADAGGTMRVGRRGACALLRLAAVCARAGGYP